MARHTVDKSFSVNKNHIKNSLNFLSIVTITFNNFEELINTVHSIDQIPNVEHVIVNGGDCLQTREFLSQYSGQHLSESDYGIADAFNKGLKLVGGEAVMFLNSGDVLLDSEYPAKALAILNEYPEFDFVHADEIYEDELIGSFVMRPLRHRSKRSPSVGRGMPYRHQTMIVRKCVYDLIGNFDLRYQIGMDFDWICRWEKTNALCHYLSGPPVVRMDGKGISSQREWHSLWEANQIIYSHFFWNFKILFDLFLRWIFFLGRQVLKALGLVKFLALMKRLKYPNLKNYYKH